MPRPKKKVNELTPGLPQKPSNLSAVASGHWDRLVAEMKDSGILLIPGFRAIIVQASVLQADLAEAWDDIQANGRYISTRTGVRKLNPAVADAHTTREKLMRVLYQLGLTPKSIGGNAGKEKDAGPTMDDILDGTSR
jgi:P27 family predicted phage terminase small subunit